MNKPETRHAPSPKGGTQRFRIARLLAGVTTTLLALAATAETITVGGTGAGYGTMKVLAAEFAKVSPGDSVVVVPNLGTGGGLKALGTGAINMAVIARPLSADEGAHGLVAFEYGRTPFIMITNTAGAGSFRTFRELAEMYAGRRTTWSEGGPVRVVLRPQHDVDTSMLETFSPDLKQAIPIALARPGMIMAPTDQDAADMVEKTPGAIGTSSLAIIITEKRNVRVLPINGIVPSARSVANGSYPWYKPMQLVRKGDGTPGVNRFFEFVASAHGRQILADSGHAVAGMRIASARPQP